ncbi:hypothetical protein GNI_196670, partial [Gregarina niphandrodes]
MIADLVQHSKQINFISESDFIEYLACTDHVEETLEDIARLNYSLSREKTIVLNLGMYIRHHIKSVSGIQAGMLARQRASELQGACYNIASRKHRSVAYWEELLNMDHSRVMFDIRREFPSFESGSMCYTEAACYLLRILAVNEPILRKGALMLVLFSRVRDVLDGSSALIKLRSYKTDRTYGDLLLKPREGTKRILRIFVEKYRSDIPQRRNSKYLFCTQSGDALSQDCLKLNPSYNWY